jgi:hypothetical protein
MLKTSCLNRQRDAQEDQDGKEIFRMCEDCGQGHKIKEGKPVNRTTVLPEKKQEKKERPKVCTIEGCKAKYFAKDRCYDHYFEMRKELKKKPVATEPEKKYANIAEIEKAIDKQTAEIPGPIITVKPEALAARKKILAKRIPKTPLEGTKRVKVTFTGQDVAIWERLRDRARKNRRDLSTECLIMLESMLDYETNAERGLE